MTTVVLEPLTSTPFFTSVQAAPLAVVTGVSNRQRPICAVTDVPSPATVISLLATTAPGAASDCHVKLNGSGLVSTGLMSNGPGAGGRVVTANQGL